MKTIERKLRLAIVSPFLDKSHGTERIIAEWIAQIADKCEIHLYSQEVRDIDLTAVCWHRIPKLPGPHLFGFLWWLAANQICRHWHRRFNGLKYDLVFSPGINCFDADVISVHIVFGEYARRMESQLRLAQHALHTWPRLLHRRLYYKLIVFLEGQIYTRPDTTLILIARKTAGELGAIYQRRQDCKIIYLGLDHGVFNAARRAALRNEARRAMGIPEGCFTLLQIGNDWRNKGVPVVLDAMARMPDSAINLIVVSRENPPDLRRMVAEKGLRDRVHFARHRRDVEFYYGAADAYAGPSLEDTFALPVMEAMACGMPVIVSSENGACEIITNGVDGLILDDPRDASALAGMIRRLCEEDGFRAELGKRAAETAQQYTWERNGRELEAIFDEVVRRKGHSSRTVTQET